jgi:hypothetical protein
MLAAMECDLFLFEPKCGDVDLHVKSPRLAAALLYLMLYYSRFLHTAAAKA